MSESVKRIKEFIDKNGLTVKDVEKKIGMSNGSLGSQIKNNKSIGSDKIENFLSTYPDVSAEWLLRGEGYMIKSENIAKENVTDEVLNLYRKVNKLQDRIDELETELTETKRRGTA